MRPGITGMVWGMGLMIGLLMPCVVSARSTSGAVSRNIILDGTIGSLAVSGSNSGGWEQDEWLQGQPGGVDWLLSWDDQNLYVGRSGGNNIHSSFALIHAGFSGSSTSNNVLPVGWFSPDLTAMGGANAFISMRSGSDFIRTFSGAAWGAADSSLQPVFGNGGGIPQMEVAIPWNLITGGNGKPDFFRIFFTQYAEDSLPVGCSATHWTYGASPWGNGVAGNGPSVGVNDGMSISAVQPEGCNSGSDSLTRWWGCFPVTGGVGPSSWPHPVPYAGQDSTICASANAIFLYANSPPPGTQGMWTIVSQPPGAAATFIDPFDPATLLQGMSQFGEYVLVWSFNTAGCAAAPDTIVVLRQGTVPVPDAGADVDLPCDSISMTLQVLNVGPFGGVWENISGLGSLLSPDSTNCFLDSLGPGESIWVWRNFGGACPSTIDTVKVVVSMTVVPDAGSDQDLCDQSSTYLSAVDPQLVQPTAWGKWYSLATPTNVYIRDSLDPGTEFFNLGPGSYNLAWRIFNGTCPVVQDTVRIRVFASPISDAGSDMTQCHFGDIQLSGNDPSLQGPFVQGYWVQRNGPSLLGFSDSTSSTTWISGLTEGEYRLDWVLNNGFCPADVDGMTLIVEELQHGGLDTLVRPYAGDANGWVEVAAPLNGYPPIIHALGSGAFQIDSVFDGLGEGSYTLTLMDGIGCSDTLMFQLTDMAPPGPLPSDSLFIPDGFSPNGDGVNDSWEIPGIVQFPEAVVEVFSPWGILVHRSEGVFVPWDGKFQGRELPQGTYYFTVDLKKVGFEIQRGALTLVR